MERTLAYIAGEFPSRSETFVYREVRELRRRGWTVHAVSLHAPHEQTIPGLQDLYEDVTVVYGSDGPAGTVRRSLAELVRHPFNALKTLAGAAGNALAPEEPLSLPSRLKLLAQAFAALGLARELRARGVEHIHCHFAHAPATLGMFASRQMGTPFSFTGHANDIFQRRSLLRVKLLRARFVACISEWHKAFYEQIVGSASDRFQVIRCGVDVSRWKENPPPAPAGAAPLRVLTVCRLVEKKGVDTLIRGLHLLGQKSGVAWQLTVAGDGPSRAGLEGLARELHCEAAIRWLGPVDNERIPELLSQADVFALPCKEDARGDRDGIPVVLMEAMACGVPAISGDLAAIRELIEHGVNGLLVDGTNPQALSDQLATLAADPALRARLGHAGRLRVEQEFSLALNVDRIESALRVAPARAPAPATPDLLASR